MQPRKASSEHRQFGSWRKSVLIIDAFELSEAFGDQSGFVPFNGTIRVVCNLVYPVATNQCFACWKLSERPSAIVLEGF